MPVHKQQYTWATMAEMKPKYIGDELLGLYDMLDANWRSWTPTLGGGGSMTYTSTTIHRARYCQIGNIVFFVLVVDGTTGGTASTYLTATVPVIPKYSTSNGSIANGAFIVDGGNVAGMYRFNGSTGGLRIFRYDGANWGLGAGREFNIQGFYEVRN